MNKAQGLGRGFHHLNIAQKENEFSFLLPKCRNLLILSPQQHYMEKCLNICTETIQSAILYHISDSIEK